MGTSSPCPSEPDRHDRRLWQIAALAVILRLAGLAFARIGSYDQDAFEWGTIAHNLLAGLGYSFDIYGDFPNSPSAFAAPLYTYLLVGYVKTFGPGLWLMAILQALAGGLVCWALGKIGTALSGRVVGLTAALICALYPEMIFMAQKFVPEPWLLLFGMLFLLCGIQYLQQEKRLWLVIAGVIAGLAALTKESALIYPLLFLVWIWLVRKASRRLLADSLLLLAVAAVILAPWTLRNYQVFGAFVPVRTGFWFNAWRGNHPGATGTIRSREGVNIDLALTPEYRDEVYARVQGNEVQREPAYRDLTWEFVIANPGRYAQLCGLRLAYLWGRDPTNPNTGSLLYWGPWAVLLAFAMAGGIVARRRWKDYSFWYLLFAVTTLVYGLTVVLPRYRIPLLPGLMLLAAQAVGAIITNLTYKTRVEYKQGDASCS